MSHAFGGAWAVARREYASFFRTALGWVVAALFLFLSGTVFAWGVLRPGEPATLREFFGLWWGLLVIVAPAVSMRLFSEELRSGTIEPLLTAPLSEAQVVGGKYLGAVLFLGTTMALSLILPTTLEVLTRPDWGPILCGYLGVGLMGLLYIAVGMFFSSLTASQTLAFLAALFLLLGWEIGAQVGAAQLPGSLGDACAALQVNPRIASFAAGRLDTANVVFFLTLAAWFVALSGVVLRARRWR